jgi:GDP-D-mannose 3', 5'-epimerase
MRTTQSICKSHDPILVAGAGGFIGGHLVADLRRQGFQPYSGGRCESQLGEWYQAFDDVENISADLENLEACRTACAGVAVVYNLAADMGGMGFIETNKARVHAVGADQHAPASAAARDAGVRALLVQPPPPASTPPRSSS